MPRKPKADDFTINKMRSMARSYAPMSIKQLAAIASASPSHAARVAACGMLLDRGYGKAEQAITGELTGNIQVVIRTLGNSDDDATLIDVTPNKQLASE